MRGSGALDKLDRLQQVIGIHFNDQSLLQLALTHRSKSKQNYERLEFLGDSILGFVVADWLVLRFASLSEGKLSRMRASVVRQEALAEVARAIGLGEYLILGEGELKSGGFDRDSILSDVFESIIGGIYLDQGLETAKTFILRQLQPKLELLSPSSAQKDPKSRLQELMQKMGYHLPRYVMIDVQGQHHDQQFTIECQLDELPFSAQATASSRRNAEQQAARILLEQHFADE